MLGRWDSSCKMVADQEVMGMVDSVAGANEGASTAPMSILERDFSPMWFGDLRQIAVRRPLPRSAAAGWVWRGIEVGHIFKLGTNYSEAMEATFQDSDGQEKPFIMGCYGIGVSRVVAAGHRAEP